MKILSIGEVLWDRYINDEYIGGAPFNFSVNANRLGHKVYFISAVGDDKRGREILRYIYENGLSRKFIHKVENYPTGYVDVIIDDDGLPTYSIHRPAAYDFPLLNSEQVNDIISFQPDWLYFGTVQQMSVFARELTWNLIDVLPKTRRFYDMNLRDGHYSKELVKELLKVSSILKLNKEETQICCKLFNKKPMELMEFCEWVVDEFKLEGVCITMGSDGCAICLDGEYIESPGYEVEITDTVGAGDAFAAGLLHGLIEKWEIRKTCKFANRLGAIAVSGNGALANLKDKKLNNLFSNY